MTDNRIFRTRTLGIPATGVKDQYADGNAAQLWELYIGDKSHRTNVYRKFITEQLRSRNCVTILDVACGTGIDSIMLLEEGFSMTSVDLSDKMLKYALKTRWSRRKEKAFDEWVIEEANWLTLEEDLHTHDSFDGVICLGNSFAHLPDDDRDHSAHRHALANFARMVKPGGVLVIDHRNYDYILKHGTAPSRNIYYNSEHIESIVTSLVITNGSPVLVTLDYVMTLDPDSEKRLLSENQRKFRLSYYPHCVKKFTELLNEAFGEGSKHKVFGDFKPLLEEPADSEAAFFIHVIEKPK